MWDAIKTDALNRLTALLEVRDLGSLDTFAITKGGPYAALIVQTMRSAYEYAKKGAAKLSTSRTLVFGITSNWHNLTPRLHPLLDLASFSPRKSTDLPMCGRGRFDRPSM